MTRRLHVVLATLLIGPLPGAASIELKEQRHDFTQQWSRSGPSGWLDTLRENPDTAFYVAHAADGWIREADLPSLIVAMDSTAPAGVACPLASAHAVDRHVRSTVGQHAAILVDSFRRNARYPGACSDLTEIDASELQQWWRQRSR